MGFAGQLQSEVKILNCYDRSDSGFYRLASISKNSIGCSMLLFPDMPIRPINGSQCFAKFPIPHLTQVFYQSHQKLPKNTAGFLCAKKAACMEQVQPQNLSDTRQRISTLPRYARHFQLFGTAPLRCSCVHRLGCKVVPRPLAQTPNAMQKYEMTTDCGKAAAQICSSQPPYPGQTIKHFSQQCLQKLTVAASPQQSNFDSSSSACFKKLRILRHGERCSTSFWASCIGCSCHLNRACPQPTVEVDNLTQRQLEPKTTKNHEFWPLCFTRPWTPLIARWQGLGN